MQRERRRSGMVKTKQVMTVEIIRRAPMLERLRIKGYQKKCRLMKN